MKIAIISSTKDEASINIKNHLIDKDSSNGLFFKEINEIFDNNKVYSYKNFKLYTINSESIHAENIDKKINADFIIFISKHKSNAAIPTLSVHSIGNWDVAEFGGSNKHLVKSSSIMMKKAFLLLNELGKDLGYEIVYEATHHGPFIDTPCFFIEIGSTIKEWENPKAARVIADVILNLLDKTIGNQETVIGIGGLHTCPEFNKAVLRNNIALSHVCPKYMVEYLEKGLILEAINKTEEKIKYILLDWKGLGPNKEKIINILEELGLPYKKTMNL